MNRMQIVSTLLFSTCVLFASMDTGATTFYVNSQKDLPNSNPGDGEALATNGHTTLRAAIEEANAIPGEHTIVLTNAIAQNSERIGLVFLEDGLRIEDDLRIVREPGIAYVIFSAKGSFQYRAIEVLPGVNFSVGGVEIYEGSQPTFDRMVADRGAVMYIGLGAHVTLSGCRFSDGVAREAGGAIYVDRATLVLAGGAYNCTSELDGGAIFNDHGTVHIGPNTLVRGHANGRGGAIFNNGGNVTIKTGTLRSRITSSSARYGGAIFSDGGYVSVESAFFRENRAEYGASIYLTNGARMSLDRCSFSDNVADSKGIIYLEYGYIGILQSIFFANAAGNSGSALYAFGGESTLINCTITENTAGIAIDEKAAAPGGAIALNAAAAPQVKLGNSIIADNVASGDSMAPDVSGTVVSLEPIPKPF